MFNWWIMMMNCSTDESMFDDVRRWCHGRPMVDNVDMVDDERDVDMSSVRLIERWCKMFNACSTDCLLNGLMIVDDCNHCSTMFNLLFDQLLFDDCSTCSTCCRQRCCSTVATDVVRRCRRCRHCRHVRHVVRHVVRHCRHCRHCSTVVDMLSTIVVRRWWSWYYSTYYRHIIRHWWYSTYSTLSTCSTYWSTIEQSVLSTYCSTYCRLIKSC